MALVTEDGTSKTDAESYITVTAASTYHSDRGNAAWAALASDAIREQALRKATEYLTQVYRDLWKGYKTTSTQALDWPRADVSFDQYISLDSDVVPVEVQRACAELALKSTTSTLYADQSQGVVREKVGAIEVEYDTTSPLAVRYKSIDGLLKPYLTRSRGTVKAVRK